MKNRDLLINTCVEQQTSYKFSAQQVSVGRVSRQEPRTRYISCGWGAAVCYYECDVLNTDCVKASVNKVFRKGQIPVWHNQLCRAGIYRLCQKTTTMILYMYMIETTSHKLRRGAI